MMALTQPEELMVELLRCRKGFSSREISFALFTLGSPGQQFAFMKWILREDPSREEILRSIMSTSAGDVSA